MRVLGCAFLFVLIAVPSVAQPRSAALRDRAPRETRAPAVPPDDAPSAWRALGASALGASLGGGLGALIGTVDPDDIDRESGTVFTDDDEDGIPLFPVGVWLGTTVGATAALQADVEGPVPLVSVVGSVMGSLFGLLGGAALGADTPAGAAIAFGVGGTVGAALPAWGHQVRNVHGSRRAIARSTWHVAARPLRPPATDAVVPGFTLRIRLAPEFAGRR